MRTWMKQVREVSYDAEDCIDIFWSKHSSGGDSSARLVKWMRKAVTLLSTLNIRWKLATEIKTLKSRAQKVSDRRLRYKLDETNVKPLTDAMVDHQKLTNSSCHSFADSQTSPIASPNTKNRQKVVDFLNGTCPSLQVMSIVGSAGLGKTTLAFSVLNSPDVRPGFDRSAIVTVSQTYDYMTLLKEIVRQLHRSPTGQADPGFQGIEACKSPEELIDKCRRHLGNIRYLVILDDVWRSTVWQQLKQAFPLDNGKKSRIIITTRRGDVAAHCSSSREDVHEMDPLSYKDSKKLLFKTVFGSEQIPADTYNEDQIRNLEPVCDAILKKCDGLPLAIVSIGGMLAPRKNEPAENWKKVIDRLPSELEKGKNLDAMRRVISLSYNDMPYYLKACFLYLSVFHEDYDIRRGPLIRRWEAEGFIKAMPGLSLEEIAKDYFDQFVSRSVVTREQLSSNGEFRNFRVHDIMLDIITVKSIQENLVSFLGNHKYNIGGHDKIRRLSIHPGSEDIYFSEGANIRHVRSLTIMDSTQKPKEITFSKLKLLRVLDLEGCQWSLSDKDWEEICKLSLLRYLSLRRTATERLPSKLGKLKGLVTLDVRQTKVTHFPESITLLQNLQHLLAGGYVHYTRTHSVKHFDYRNKEVVKIPSGLSKMKALKRISFVDVSGRLQALQEVAKLSHLTRLSVIQTDSNASWGNFGDTLSKLSNSLRYLSIIMQDEVAKEDQGPARSRLCFRCCCFCSCGWSKQATETVTAQPQASLAGQLNFLLHTKKLLDSPPILLHSLHLLGRIDRLPPWFQDLSKLASLSLRHTYIADIAVLERLPSLVSLKLYSGAFTGSTLGFASGHFPVLKQLVIDNLTGLVVLKFVDDGAKNLERLTLYLPKEDTAISGIDGLEKLKTVELFGINDPEVLRKVKEQADANPKKPIVTIDERPPPPRQLLPAS